MKNLYESLDVSKDASTKDIKDAYREKSKEHHPDHGGDPKVFHEICESYKVLIDPGKRNATIPEDPAEDPERQTKRSSQWRRRTLLSPIEAADVERQDIIKAMKERSLAQRADIDNKIITENKSIKKKEKALVRLTTKAGKNILADVLHNMIGHHHEQIKDFEEKKEKFMNIHKFIENYEYKVDKPSNFCISIRRYFQMKTHSMQFYIRRTRLYSHDNL